MKPSVGPCSAITFTIIRCELFACGLIIECWVRDKALKDKKNVRWNRWMLTDYETESAWPKRFTATERAEYLAREKAFWAKSILVRSFCTPGGDCVYTETSICWCKGSVQTNPKPVCLSCRRLVKGTWQVLFDSSNDFSSFYWDERKVHEGTSRELERIQLLVLFFCTQRRRRKISSTASGWSNPISFWEILWWSQYWWQTKAVRTQYGQQNWNGNIETV